MDLVKPCVKHKCKFSHNSKTKTVKVRPSGTSVSLKVVGIYKCQHCTFERIGVPSNNAPFPKLL